MGVDFMDPMISRNVWIWYFSNVYIADFVPGDRVG